MPKIKYVFKGQKMIWPTLPSEYQRVEYIQSSSTTSGTEGINGQTIKTGITPTNNTKIEIKISNFTQNGSFAIFGEDISWGSSGFTVISRSYEFGTNAVFDDGTASTRTICDGNTHVIKLSQTGLIVDGVTKASPSSASFTGVGLNLFSMNRNGTSREFGGFRMYYCSIWDGNELVRHFVPCYRKSDNVIGLYDIVGGTFYTNQGSGSFTKGGNI